MTGERGWQLRQALVDDLKREGRVHSARVEAALRAVPREVFVPGVPLDEVYRPSDAIVVKRLEGISVSSASAPDVVAVMLEQLAVEPGQRVLEVGAGTGYNAALLAELVGSEGQVVAHLLEGHAALAAGDGQRQHQSSPGRAELLPPGRRYVASAHRQDHAVERRTRRESERTVTLHHLHALVARGGQVPARRDDEVLVDLDAHDLPFRPD